MNHTPIQPAPRRPRSPRPPRSHGFAAIDATLGLTLIVALTGLVITTTLRQDKAIGHLADQRAAMRLAETTLLTLQAGAQAPTPDDTVSVHIEPLQTSSNATPPGHHWARVTTTYGNTTATLIGLIPGEAP